MKITLSKASVRPAGRDFDAAARPRPHGLDFDAKAHLAADLADELEQALEHGAIAARHVAEVLLLCGGIARREEPLHVGPDEDRGHPTIVFPELCEQERLPHLLEGRAPGMADEEFLDSHVLEAAPVVDARAIEDGRREPEFAPETEQREAQEIEPARERMDCTVDIEAGLRRAPAQPVREPDAAHEIHECRVGRQDHVVEAIPREVPEIVPGGEAARLFRTLVNRDGIPGGTKALRKREPHEPAADDADSHAAGFRPRHGLQPAARSFETARCHSIVRVRPSSMSTRARTPRSRSQCATSGTRRITSSYFRPVNDA